MESSVWHHGVALAVDVTLLSRFYERYADHALGVAQHVIFLATGKPLRQAEIGGAARQNVGRTGAG